MSQKRSSKRPTPSPGVGNEPRDRRKPAALIGSPSTPSDALVVAAAALIAEFGTFGLVWLDSDLIATQRFGRLVDFVQIGQPITDSVLAFIGLEDEIRGLFAKPGDLIELPAVGVAQADGEARRLNFSIMLQSGSNTVLVLVYRVASQTDLELELSRQIRARLMADAAVAAKSNELIRANADLESFASIVSHDLTGPMRHMRGLAQDLLGSTERADAAAMRAKLGDVARQADRMARMLSGLLDYSSLGRKDQALEDVDTRALIDTVVGSLPTCGIAVKITGSWPTLVTLAAPLDLVLRNVIDNALKHHDTKQGSITVDCAEAAHALILTIADDGPGIEPKHHAAAFLPFRTLATNESGRGTGMGLALVKKTVETVGGSVSLASDPSRSRGVTFTIIWPKWITA